MSIMRRRYSAGCWLRAGHFFRGLYLVCRRRRFYFWKRRVSIQKLCILKQRFKLRVSGHVDYVFDPLRFDLRFLRVGRFVQRRENNVEIIYGTIRLIEQDKESFLAWAKKPYACVIFNLHVVHTRQGIRHAADAFRRLIDIGIKYGGSYFPTYHKYATRTQVQTCYPQFAEFLELKRKYDPDGVFQSDWFRHHRKMFTT